MIVDREVRQLLIRAEVRDASHEVGGQGSVSTFARDIVDALAGNEQVAGQEAHAAWPRFDARGNNGAMFVVVAGKEVAAKLHEHAAWDSKFDVVHWERSQSKTL